MMRRWIFYWLPVLVLVAVGAMALFAGVLASHDPLAQDVDARLLPPSREHWFGTDGFGRDVWSRVVFGARASLTVGALAVVLAGGAGIAIGVVSAYAGGAVDLVAQRFVDALLGFPFLVLALVAVVALSPSAVSVGLAVAIAMAPQVARMARATTLRTKGEAFVTAARVSGAGHRALILRHILPNCLSPLIAQLSGLFGTAVAAEATLSFLGLGVPPPFPSWGRMLQEGARQYFEAAPWVTLLPGTVLSLTVVSFALLGDFLRDLLERRR
jgi:peptide/nickel transport system permease protein